METQASTWKRRDLSILQCAVAYKLFLVTKLVYSLHMLGCLHFSIQWFHGIFTTKIWKLNFEPMKRNSLFMAVHDGALHFQHLSVQQLLMRPCFLCRHRHSVLRAKLQNIDPVHHRGLVVASTSGACVLSVFYRKVVDAICFLLARFSPEHIFKSSKLKLKK